MINNISVESLKKFERSNIIDIRCVESYNNGHIDGAKNISFNNLLISPNKYLNRSDTYYIYCQRGLKSSRLCQILSINGYKVINILGGYEAWILSK